MVKICLNCLVLLKQSIKICNLLYRKQVTPLNELALYPCHLSEIASEELIANFDTEEQVVMIVIEIIREI